MRVQSKQKDSSEGEDRSPRQSRSVLLSQAHTKIRSREKNVRVKNMIYPNNYPIYPEHRHYLKGVHGGRASHYHDCENKAINIKRWLCRTYCLLVVLLLSSDVNVAAYVNVNVAPFTAAHCTVRHVEHWYSNHTMMYICLDFAAVCCGLEYNTMYMYYLHIYYLYYVTVELKFTISHCIKKKQAGLKFNKSKFSRQSK